MPGVRADPQDPPSDRVELVLLSQLDSIRREGCYRGSNAEAYPKTSRKVVRLAARWPDREAGPEVVSPALGDGRGPDASLGTVAVVIVAAVRDR